MEGVRKRSERGGVGQEWPPPRYAMPALNTTPFSSPSEEGVMSLPPPVEGVRTPAAQSAGVTIFTPSGGGGP